MKPAAFYNKELTENAAGLKSVLRKLTINSTYRLVSFLAILGFIFGLTPIHAALGISTAILSAIFFGFFIKRHIKLTWRKNYLKTRSRLLEQELDATNHIFKPFNGGLIYQNAHHHYSNDLDLFGEGSLFQMINRTVTQSGEQLLAEQVTHEQLNKEKILNTQEAVRELSQLPDFLLHFRTIGSMDEMVEEDKKQLLQWTQQHSYIKRFPLLNYLRYILPPICLTSMVLVFWGFESSIFITLFIINLLIIGKFFKKSGEEHSEVTSFLKVLKKYQNLIELFQERPFKSKILISETKNLKEKANGAADALKQLTKTVDAFDSRMNLVAAIFLQGLLLWDFHCLFKIQKWKKTYGHQVINWIENIGALDALVSKGNFAFNNPGYIYPIPTEETVIDAIETGHPFIPAQVNVTNNFSIKKQGVFYIITGANMAGKSTFLRTIGANLILAMAGMPVMAEKFSFKPRKIFTSMRTSDNLNENESYFYAELRRLKELIDLLKNGEDIFIMLDEILKGTNSLDKQKGSQLALEKILQLKGTGIIATHDLALTEMEVKHPVEVKNKCFEIEIEKAEILFDYKLYDGVTKNMNAMLLMEQMGIV